MKHIYVRGTGQEDNIGDVVLRRVFFDELSKAGKLHILLGDASADFIEALDLRATDVVYRSADAWRRAAYRSVIRRSTWLVDKPGELLLEEDIYKGQRRLLPLILAVRARGGKSLRLGVGQRKPNPAVIGRFRRLYRLSSAIAWRDVESQAHFGIGEIMPDWGFLPEPSTATGVTRDRLVLSYRSDRRTLNTATLTAIRGYAEQEGLRITVVTQVARDSEKSKELHRALGGDLIDWASASDHRLQEERLRAIYQETTIALSDRLHVLIVAATEGAVPVNLVTESDPKVSRHFDAIGYAGVSALVADEVDVQDLSDVFRRHLNRSDEIAERVAVARSRIRDVARRTIAPRS